jgi:urease accessory protein UreE
MIERLGARVTRRRAPFAPEPGAYPAPDADA